MKRLYFLLTLVVFLLTNAFGQAPTSGLVAYYPFNGNANDAVGSNHGTINGTPTYPSGVVGNAIRLNAFSVLIPQIITNSTTAFSISIWVKEESLTNNDGEGYISFGDHSDSGWLGILHGDAGRAIEKIYFAVNGGANIAINPPTNYKNNWVNYQMSYSSGTLKAFVNGVNVGQLNSAIIKIGHNKSGIGTHSWGNGSATSTRFVGSIDNLRIYNRALSDAEVQALYQAEAPPAAAGISLTTPMRFGGGLSTLYVGTGYNLTAAIKNNGSTSWVGDVYLKVKGGTPMLLSNNNVIAAGGTYNLSTNFSPQTAHIGQNVIMELLTKQGSNDFVRVATVNGTVNPLMVNIEAAGVEPDKIPFINVNKSQYNLGETIQITGRNFLAGQTVTLSSVPTLSGITYPTLTVSTDGSISGNLTIPNTGLTGSYLTVIVKDSKGYNPKKLVSLSLPDQREPLKVIEPNTQMNFNGGIYVGVGRDFLPVKWIDPLKVDAQVQFSPGGALRRVRYKIEFEANVTNTITLLHTYDTYTTLDFIETYNYDVPRSALTSLVNPSTQEAQGRIKITNLDEPTRFAKSDLITIYLGSISSDLKVELLWDKSNPSTNLPPVRGLIADGVSRVFVKVSKINPLTSPSIQSVQLDLIDVDNASTDPKWLGKLMYANNQMGGAYYSTEANTANAISANNIATNASNNYLFWYVSPDDFMIDGKPYQSTNYRTVKLRARILLQGASQPVEVNMPLTIVRPPLMLVHGLNGSGLGTWNDFSLQYEIPFLGNSNKVDVLPGGSYDANSKILMYRPDATPRDLKNSFQGTLKLMHEKGYAANQVDYICHSMGGDMIRYAVENYPTDFYQNNHYPTYGAGFANKVITINTPHQGSPLADLINGFVDYIPTKYKAAIAADYHIAKALNAKDKFHKTIFSMIKVSEGAAISLEGSEAVIDLQAISGNGGKKFRTPFNFPTHIIAGDIVQGDQGIPDFSNTVLNVDRWSSHFQFLYKLVEFLREYEYKVPNNELPPYMVDFVEFYKEENPEDFKDLIEKRDDPLDQIEVAIKVMQNFWLWATSYTDFLTEGDLIVGLRSQLSGLPRTASNVSVLNGALIDINKFHTSIIGDNQAINKVRELLNKAIYNPNLGSNQLFGSVPATYNAQIGSPNVMFNGFPKQQNVRKALNTNSNVVVIEKRDPNMMKILSPIRGSQVVAGENVNVQIQVTDSTHLERLRVSFQSFIKSETLKRKTFKYGFGINETFNSKETIFVTATFFRNDTAYYIQDTLSVKVAHNGVVNGFAVFPESKSAPVGNTIEPTYEFRYPSYLSYDLDKSKMAVSVSNSSAVSYNSQTGNLNTLNKGEAVVIFTYDGIFKDTMYVAVGGGGLPYSQQIQTSNVPVTGDGTICTGATISVPFTTTGGVFDAGNQYIVQLSDASGENFVSLTTTGTASPLLARIPNGLSNADTYKIRVVSTSPPVIGTAAVQTLKIRNQDATPIVSVQTGNWNDPATWSCKRIPSASDNVTIKAGHRVNLSVGAVGQCRNLTTEPTAIFDCPTGAVFLANPNQ